MRGDGVLGRTTNFGATSEPAGTVHRKTFASAKTTQSEQLEIDEEASEAVTLVTAAQPTVTPYMNSAALNEIAGELLITVRELREELLQV